MREGFPSLHILGNVDCYVPHMRSHIYCIFLHSIPFLLLACLFIYIGLYRYRYHRYIVFMLNIGISKNHYNSMCHHICTFYLVTFNAKVVSVMVFFFLWQRFKGWKQKCKNKIGRKRHYNCVTSLDSNRKIIFYVGIWSKSRRRGL